MKTIRVIAALLLIISLSACSLAILDPSPRTFSKAGLEITLDDSFTEKEHNSYTALYDSASAGVVILKEEFSLFPNVDTDNMSVSEYATLVIQTNNRDAEVKEKDSLVYFVFEAQANGKNFTYFCPVFKASDAFWLVQFFCTTENYASMESQFFSWAKTIKLS